MEMKLNKEIEFDIQECITDLKFHGDPERARQQKRYLKSPFDFYGVRKPLLNQWAKKIRRSNPDITQKKLIQVCETLWRSSSHDQKTLAIELLKAYPKYIDDNELPLIESMIHEAKGWDLIDNIAIWLIGELIRKDSQKHKLIKVWSTNDNFWIRRAAIISPIKLFKRNECDLNIYEEIWKKHLDEKEFFIRKGIGWVLRELSKTNPDRVFKFIQQNKDAMCGLTFREASRNLSEAQHKMLYNKRS
jgi:3-methyladenine DNA glycosylase AlkD